MRIKIGSNLGARTPDLYRFYKKISPAVEIAGLM